MKKLLMVVTAVFLMFPVAGFGLDLSEVKYSVNGGIMYPMGDLDDAGMDMGFTIGGMGLMPSTIGDEITWGLAAAIGMMSGEKSGNGIKAETDLTILELLPTARYTVESGDLTFFGQAGLGFAYGKMKVDYTPEVAGFVEDEDDTDTEFGFAFGGGVKFMEKFEAMALYKSFGDADYISITVGYVFE